MSAKALWFTSFLHCSRKGPLNCLVLRYMETGCCPKILEAIDARVIELAASEPLRFCPNCAAIATSDKAA